MNIKKLNSKSTINGTKFVLSTSDIDRSGDKVIQNWDLKDFLANPIALAFHNHDAPIGIWENVAVVGNQLTGSLKLAKVGTSAFIDSIHKLVDQDILRATSIGFRSEKAKPNGTGGYNLDKNYLFEVSLVSVPDNQNALRKEFSYLSTKEIDSICSMSGCSLSKSKEDNLHESKTIKISHKGLKMKLPKDRIVELNTQISKNAAALDTLNEIEELTETQLDEMETLNDSISKDKGLVARFEKMENDNFSVDKRVPAVIEKKVEMDKNGVADFIVKSALVSLESGITGISIQESIDKRYGTETMMKSAAAYISKAATPQDPAMTTVPEWAGALVRDGFGAFLDLIQPRSVVAQLPLERYSFNGYHSLKIPMRTKMYPADKNLAGAFVGEGEPIRIGAATLGSITLTPKKLAVIGTFTSEMFEQSTPNIETAIKKWMIQDTSIMIDTLFLDAAAGTTVRPAGVTNGVTPIPATGATIDKIDADLEAAVAAMEAAGAGVNMRWIMSDANARKLTSMRNATGDPAYPSMGGGNACGGGSLLCIGVVSSTTVTSDKVYLIDCDAVAISGGTPQFLASATATLHEEYDAASVAPIVDGTGTAAKPVRSLYQTDSHAIRLIEPLDWASLRDGSVQVITGFGVAPHA